MKFLVNYTMCDNNEWRSIKKEEIIEVDNEEEVRKIIKDRSNYSYDYYVDSIRKIEEEN